MSVLAWLVIGLVAGFLASRIVNKRGEGFVVDTALGVVGAIVGGVIFDVLGQPAASGVDLYSLLVAVIGAVVTLLVYHAAANSRV